MIDSRFAGNPKYPAGHELDSVDLVLVTHGHPDHIGNLLTVAEQFEPEIVCSYEIYQWLDSKSVKKVMGMNKGGCHHTQGVQVSMTQAQHSSSIYEDGQIIYGGGHERVL